MDDLMFLNDEDNSTTLAVIGLQAALAPLDGIDETAQIAETAALKIEWDKKAGVWRTDLGESDNLNVGQFAARRIWAKWTNIVGQPEAMGWGNAPDGCDAGYAVVMDTEEFGVVTGQFFGLTSRVISSAAKKFVREGQVEFMGKVPVNTKFGLFYNPKVQ